MKFGVAPLERPLLTFMDGDSGEHEGLRVRTGAVKHLRTDCLRPVERMACIGAQMQPRCAACARSKWGGRALIGHQGGRLRGLCCPHFLTQVAWRSSPMGAYRVR